MGHIDKAIINVEVMILRSENKKQREFKGTSFNVLASGDKSMVTKMNYRIGDNVPLHSHLNEQSGYVISGEYIIHYGEITERIKSHDCYCNSENAANSGEVLTVGEVIDVFTHPRIENL